MPEETRSTPPRTLAEALRLRDDASLKGLLRARPDLLTPVPGDLSALATRAGTRASVFRALEHLDRFTLQTAEALAVAPDPAPYPTLLALMGGEECDPVVEAELPGAVTTLREQALVWGQDDRLRLVRTAREQLAPSPTHPSPTGLGPTVAEATVGVSPGRVQEIVTAVGLAGTHDSVSAVAALTALFTDRQRMSALLDKAPVESLNVLSRLVWGPPYGEVAADPARPVRWLRDHGLLLPVNARTVVLPREVALHLRAGRAHRITEPRPPAIAPAREYGPQAVDAAAAGQAFTALDTIEELFKDWNEGGPTVLRSGGLSVRDLRRTAAALGTTEQHAAFWIELAFAAGLLATDGGGGTSRSVKAAGEDERYAATPAYDAWLESPAPDRWARLATAWLTATRVPGLIGGLDAKGRALSALGPGLDRSAAPEVRRRVLALMSALPAGTAPEPESLLARLRWERPVRGTTAGRGAAQSSAADIAAARYSHGATAVGDLRSRIAQWTMNETELLGITGRGALAAPGRALLGGREPEKAAGPAPSAADFTAARSRAAAALAPLIPVPLDHVLLQADLTAVAPGPLERPLAELLGVAADIESKGGATVYRFTAGSVRRALDAGQTASDLHAFLATHSRTPVPQPLTYLIDDVARKHGHLRVGAASSYVRCDDDAVLSEILADARSQSLRLRRLAPTVLAAQTDPGGLLDGLRAMGFAPAAESAEGDVVITRADAYRTVPRTAPVPVPEGPPAPDDTLLGAALRAIRAGDTAATVDHKAVPEQGDLPRTPSAETLATVQAATMTGAALWIGYVNADGAASRRVIAPVRVEGGFVTAYDHTTDDIRTYPLHRITGVAELTDEPSTRPERS